RRGKAPPLAPACTGLGLADLQTLVASVLLYLRRVVFRVIRNPGRALVSRHRVPRPGVLGSPAPATQADLVDDHSAAVPEHSGILSESPHDLEWRVPLMFIIIGVGARGFLGVNAENKILLLFPRIGLL